MSTLLNVDQALAQILENVATLPAELRDTDAALGFVLAAAIKADISLPPFPNSNMDGFAVRAADIAGASSESPVSLHVALDIPAGSAPDGELASGEAARIMTGAPMPDGADAVVPVEDTNIQWDAAANTALPSQVTIYRRVNSGDYVRAVGENIQAGQTVLQAGTLVRPQDIGLLASLGRPQIPVIRQPRVAIISTGDELVGINDPLAPGKIRDSNSHTIAALVASNGAIPIRLPTARDTLEAVRGCFRQALAQSPDVIISSAGVSVGTFDIVRAVLDELGQVDFWRVNLRPGKPLAFGQLQGVSFFGLPGNPVSAMITFDIFVRPVLLKLAGKPNNVQTTTAIAAEDLQSDGRRSYLRVRLARQDGRLLASTTGTQSSGALMSMVLADGLLIIPEGVTEVEAGTELEVRLLRDLGT